MPSYQSLFEHAALGIISLNTRGNCLHANQKFCALLGYTQEELLQRRFEDLIHPDDREAGLTIFHQIATASVSTATVNIRYLRRDDASVATKVMFSSSGSSASHDYVILGFVEVIQDSTEKTATSNPPAALDILGTEVVAARQTGPEDDKIELYTQQVRTRLLEKTAGLLQLSATSEDIRIVGRELTELTCSVLDCAHVGIYMVEGEKHTLSMLAALGWSEEQEQACARWLSSESVNLATLLPPAMLSAFMENETLVIDARQPEFTTWQRLYPVENLLVVPILFGGCLLAVLAIDHGMGQHTYTSNERMLASTIARLAALVLERPRLLTERSEAQSRVLALQDARTRMEDFLGLASHELRTPLTTIKANTQLSMRRLKSILQRPELLLEGTDSKVRASFDMLERVDRQVGVLNRLVGDMLDVSRIQAGRLQMHMRQEPCELLQIVETAIKEQHKAVPERNITVHFASQDPMLIMVDPDRIKQVVNNYLSNALKYSEADQPVAVVVQLDQEIAGSRQVRVTVQDKGSGIVAEEQPHIWECFYQSPSSKPVSGSGVGLGLGLYINQTLIERHGGQVGVVSVPGEGSLFWFTLPLSEGEQAIAES
ncbi:sensor histidine kinase [Dictyobacter vulcani]|uniref:histidine kinase n=2 Tax=Dictyobacter vulcani TaxID=2607529 RepID=A0A5J4KKJ4_9CHLR|nr:sensor histidine kinase [Dictyobacter vulcani]